MAKTTLTVLFLLATSNLFAEQTTVVPVVAWGAPGAFGNRWFTEVYLSNPTLQTQEVLVAGFEVLRMKESPHPCVPPNVPIPVSPLQTKLLAASELSRWLGCPEEFVGGVLLQHGAGLLVSTRMTNAKGFESSVGSDLLRGFSQEIPGVPLEHLIGEPGAVYMVPALVWHPQPCGATLYDTYLYFNNPGEADVEVHLLPREGEAMTIKLGNVEVQLPYLVKVPAGRVVQLAVQPAASTGGEGCGQPQVFDLFIEADGKLAVLASVVDRASNDARTVLVGSSHRVLRP
ncbi:MAG: hypothetical protein ACK42L_01650 [Thermoanaerobaculum sp.]